MFWTAQGASTETNVYLTKQRVLKHIIMMYWIYIGVGHGNSPMDGVGSFVKTAIKDTAAFNPNAVINNREELLDHLPLLPNFIVGIYTGAADEKLKLNKNK